MTKPFKKSEKMIEIDVTSARHIWPDGWKNSPISWQLICLRVRIAREQATSFGTSSIGFWWNEVANEQEKRLPFNVK